MITLPCSKKGSRGGVLPEVLRGVPDLEGFDISSFQNLGSPFCFLRCRVKLVTITVMWRWIMEHCQSELYFCRLVMVIYGA